MIYGQTLNIYRILSGNSGYAECTATICEDGIDGNGLFANKSFVKRFTVTKSLRGPIGEDGATPEITDGI
jgi:hypothetical protein